MRKFVVLIIILIGFTGLFVSQSLSFSTATVPVGAKLAVTNNDHALIASASYINVHFVKHTGPDKGQHEVIRVTNNLKQAITINQDDIYPLVSDKFFHIQIEQTVIEPGAQADVKLTFYAHKNKTPSGDYDMTLQAGWSDGSSTIPITIHLNNDQKK